MQNDEVKLSRRNFLARVVKTSAVAGVTIAAGRYFQDRNPVPPQEAMPTVSPFDVPGTESVFAVARGKNPYALTREAIDAVGGMKRFIKEGDKVLIKVNCAFARPAWMGATTSPEVTSEVIRLCREAGASAVRVTDNPISDPKSCFLKSGLGSVVEKAGGRVFLPRRSHFRRVHVNDGSIGTWEVFYEPLKWCDKLIGIPTVKTHNLCGASLTMKNWYGFFGGSRARFHQDIHRVVAELAEFITPTLVVLDGTRLLVKNGPTGGSAQDVEPGDTVAASTDQVGLDCLGAELLGLERGELEFIDLAEGKGLGKADYRTLPGFREIAL